MPKGYIIARLSVDDPGRFAEYAKRAAEAQKKHGAKVLVRGGPYEALEGEARNRNVVLEFPSYEAAMAYYHSEEYQAARRFRVGAATADILAVEGFDPD